MVILPFHPLEVSASERKVYRLFAIDLPAHHIPAFTRPKRNTTGGSDYPLRDALGVSHLDEQFVQILKLDDLGEMKLSEYMQEGLGIAPDDLSDHRERLDALDGYLAVVSVSAFEAPAMISPKPPVSLVGAFAEHEDLRRAPNPTATSATQMQPAEPAKPPAPRDAWAWHRWLWPALGGAIAGLAVVYFIFAKGAP